MPRKNKKLLFLFLLFLGLFVSWIAFSYSDTTTHPKLTQATINFYNQKADKKITDKQAKWIIKGAIEEDSPWPSDSLAPADCRFSLKKQNAREPPLLAGQNFLTEVFSAKIKPRPYK